MSRPNSVELIKQQLDGLERTSIGSSGLILILIWSALQNHAEIEIFGITAKRENVYVVAGLSLSAVYLASSLYYLRVRKLIAQFGGCAPTETILIVTKHAWPMNPFANFSASKKLSWSDGASRALIPFLWTLGCGCLWSISIPYQTWYLALVMLLYVGCGALMIFHIIKTVTVLVELSKTAPECNLPNMRRQAIVISAFGIVIGLAADILLDIVYRYYS